MSSSRKSYGCMESQTYNCKDHPPLFFIMMRLNVKVTIIFLIVISSLTILILWSICQHPSYYKSRDWKEFSNSKYNKQQDELIGAEEIDCEINGEYTIACRKEGDEVYIPFSFLHKYFEVYGKLTTYDGLERFEWSHSYSKIYHPKEKYDPRGQFMYFQNYNVELRDRVKCVSATEGVPVSTQWESQGYYYPTQIAQFGLSHYSKNLTETEPRRKIIDDSEKFTANWICQQTNNAPQFKRALDTSVQSTVLIFNTSDSYLDSVVLKMDHLLDFVMSLNILLGSNSSFTVTLQNRETKSIYNLHYVSSDLLITAQDNNIYHGIGMLPIWKKLTRDLIIDLQKGLHYLDREKFRYKLPRSKMKVIKIALTGYGSIDNLTFSTSEHIQQFYDAADWFVRNQDEEAGGWPIPVTRRLASGFQDLHKGWYSSMGQGHAISVLARAYHHSGGELRYLKAALNALKPFRILSKDGGVLATFHNQYKWYEEYPTTPASFVLNGFIYSLIGLYDLLTIAPYEQTKEAEALFKDGMTSLKNMLPLFDMGTVTAYDLRHYTLRIAPNLARWDYHATHINQLLLIGTIENDDIFTQTADRWIGYMSGKRAAHN